MTKEVLVTLCGLQMGVGDVEEHEEPIELFSAGTYYFKEGTHYIFFEELVPGAEESTRTQIRLHGTQTLEVIKKGLIEMHMVLEKNHSNRCYYKTPFGQMNLGISTSQIFVEETEDNINIRAEYSLDVDFAPLAECTIRINVKPRGSKEFSLHEPMTF